MADSQPPATAAPAAAATDLESKEIWGDEADQLDEEVMKVECVKCDMVDTLRATISSFRCCRAKLIDRDVREVVLVLTVSNV